MTYEFRSNVPNRLRNNLENLFFFNSKQSDVYSKIEKALEKYGNPYIHENDGKCKIGLEKLKDCQNLILVQKFSDNEKILGIILHSRIQKEKAEIIHIAIDNNQVSKDNEYLKIMMNEIFRIYKSIKGVKMIEITYIGKELKIH